MQDLKEKKTEQNQHNQRRKNDEFLALKVDRIFKTICLDEKEHFDLLNCILSEILDMKIKINAVRYNELPVNTKYEKVKILDVIVSNGYENYDIEINAETNKVMRQRNFAYLSACFNQDVYRGEDYDPNTKYIQVNINWNQGYKKTLIKTYRLSNVVDPSDLYIENFLIVEFNMDRLSYEWYNNNEILINKYMHVLLLDLDEEGLKKLKSEDEIVNKYKKRIMKINKDSDFVWYTPEEEERMLRRSEHKYYKSEGFKEGFNEGYEKIIKKMAAEGSSYEYISKVSDLSVDEVKKILNN